MAQLVAEEMKFELGWNSTSTTRVKTTHRFVTLLGYMNKLME